MAAVAPRGAHGRHGSLSCRAMRSLSKTAVGGSYGPDSGVIETARSVVVFASFGVPQNGCSP